MPSATALAHSNIALVKYWGKADRLRNLPAVSSLSLTLDGLATRTTVAFDEGLATDELWLNGQRQQGRPLQRASRLLDTVRGWAGSSSCAHIRSTNDFPTASGLASSASGFAALAAASCAAAGLHVEAPRVSALARAASASAARSIHPGFVLLPRGAEAAEPWAAADHWPVRLLIAVTDRGPKSVGSTEGMQRCEETSPYYSAWVEGAEALYERAKAAVRQRDLEALGDAMEQSTLRMHAAMHAAVPPVFYWLPATIAVLRRVWELRAQGTLAYATMDAGPHVKVLVSPADADIVYRALNELPGVSEVLVNSPGPGCQLTDGGVE